MKNREGAKKLYKAHKTWIAAGLAAATLFSVQAFNTQNVSAATPGTTVAASAVTTAELHETLQKNKAAYAQYGSLTNAVTGRTFYGDFDYINSQIGTTITTKAQLFNAMKPILEGLKPILKAEVKAQVAAVGNQIYPASGRTFYGELDYLFNSATVSADETGASIDLNYAEVQAVLDAAKNVPDEANQAFRDGQQYGETGATLPDLSNKSQTYRDNFAKGFAAGAAVHAQKLAAAQAEATQAYRDGQQYGETGAVLPDLSNKSQNYRNNFAKGFAAGAAVHAQKLAAVKAEANQAFRDGQQYGETGAVLPDLSNKSQNYRDNFAKGFAAGAAVHAQKLAAAKAEANQAFRDGQQYGETGAVLPDLSNKSQNYRNNFAKGFDAGAAVHAEKLAAAKAEANQAFVDGQRYGETGAVLPDLSNKSQNYRNNFAKGFDAGAATRAQKLEALAAKHAEEMLNNNKQGADFVNFKKDEDTKLAAKFAKTTPTTPSTTQNGKTTTTVKPATTPAKVVQTGTTAPKATAAVKTVAATAATAKTLPKTGDSVNTVASSLGVVAVMGALFGLAGTSLKKRA